MCDYRSDESCLLNCSW